MAEEAGVIDAQELPQQELATADGTYTILKIRLFIDVVIVGGPILVLLTLLWLRIFIRVMLWNH